MRSNFPSRPQGTHTWIKATFLPPNRAIILRLGDHVYVWAHPTSAFAGNQKHVHHVVSVGQKLNDGEISVESTNVLMPTNVNANHLRCLQRYIDRGVSPQEIPVIMAAYGLLADAYPVPDQVKALRESLMVLLPVA